MNRLSSRILFHLLDWIEEGVDHLLDRRRRGSGMSGKYGLNRRGRCTESQLPSLFLWK
jgi:hypothetical protein